MQEAKTKNAIFNTKLTDFVVFLEVQSWQEIVNKI